MTFSHSITDRYFEDYVEADVHRFGSIAVEADEVIAFAKRFDPQAMHTDPEAAKHTIFGGLIASGWHTAAVWMKLMIAHRYAQLAAGEEATQDNYVSPGVRDLRWLKPVRPGTSLTYTTEPFNKVDWPSRPALGLLQSRNEARDETGELYYSFTSQVLIARRPV